MSRDLSFHPLTVIGVVDETADTRSFVFAIPPQVEAAFRYAAGQFCTFRAMIGGASIARCYSMSSSPERGEPFTVTVKRVPGGIMSNWMNDTLRPGAAIDVLPPAGLFVLRDNSAPIVGFAGGSGITPLLSIIKTALVTTARPIALVYANRNESSVIFEAELDRLGAEFPGRLSVHHHLDSRGGLLDAEACAELIGDRSEADFYVCGPAPFMTIVEKALDLCGVDASRRFIERFELADEPAVAEESVTESITVRLNGRQLTVPYQAGESILDTVRRAALKPPFSCTAGNCGTCMAFLAAGSARMRANNVLDADEVQSGYILTCQAIPLSREVSVDYDR